MGYYGGLSRSIRHRDLAGAVANLMCFAAATEAFHVLALKYAFLAALGAGMASTIVGLIKANVDVSTKVIALDTWRSELIRVLESRLGSYEAAKDEANRDIAAWREGDDHEAAWGSPWLSTIAGLAIYIGGYAVWFGLAYGLSRLF